MGELSNGPILDPHLPTNPPNRGEGVEKSPFEIATERLEMDHICQ